MEHKTDKPKLAAHTTSEEKKAAHKRLRELMSGINGDDIDLKQLRAERRMEKHGRTGLADDK